MRPQVGQLDPPQRLLMGPGPSNVPARVREAMSLPLLGHLDPAFLELMNQAGDLMRYLFQTRNRLTLALPGTGSAGMEGVLANLIAPGDRVLVGVCGVFGQRMADMAHRHGAEVLTVEAPWGQGLQPEQVEEALQRAGGIKLVALVHGETSTGVLQSLPEMAEVAHRHEALLVVDAVATLGGVPFFQDEWGVDVAYSGSQKCLSCPPGMAPISLNEEAAQKVAQREEPVRSWYLDLNMIQRYWGEERFYHHTAPINMVYALREALRLIAEEELDKCWERHRQAARALVAGVRALGLEVFSPDEWRMPTLIPVCIPEEVEDTRVRKRLLGEYGIEVGGGLGPTKGKVWRIGLMGMNARRANVHLVLSALSNILRQEGATVDAGAALAAAEDAFQEA